MCQVKARSKRTIDESHELWDRQRRKQDGGTGREGCRMVGQAEKVVGWWDRQRKL